jgi:dTDP-4-dehydrorhamnose reductase
MRMVILGAGGMLGHELVASAPPGVAVFPFTRSDLDIINTELLPTTVADVRPEVVINALAGEAALRQSQADFLLVRTQWLLEVHGKSFPRTMWERAKAGAQTKVVRDQTGRPTSAWDLARTIWALTRQRALGVLHVANDGSATWFDVASHIFGRAGRSDLLSACVTAEYPTAAPRPRYSVLGTTRFEREVGTRRFRSGVLNRVARARPRDLS